LGLSLKLFRREIIFEVFQPMTVSPVISKIFEFVLVPNYGSFLNVNDRQFGFKRNIGCSKNQIRTTYSGRK